MWVLSRLAPIVLHHDPDAAKDAEGLRAFLGEASVHQVSVVLHTTGALLVAGALVAVLLMRSQWTRGTDGGPAWSLTSRGWVRGVLIGGWGINFLGGAMRLFEPDHPGLAHIGELAWVQVLLLKHLALLAAIGLSLLAVEYGPVAWTRMRGAAVGALVLVLFSSLAGGVSSGLPLNTDMDMDGGEGEDTTLAIDEPIVSWHNTTGIQMTGTPLNPARVEVPLPVPPLATEILVQIEHVFPRSGVHAYLVDPSGERRAKSGNVTDTQAELSLTKNLTAGSWTIELLADRAAQETVDLYARVTQGVSGPRVLEETVTVSGRGFEVNLYIDPDVTLDYSWRLASGDSAITWDIHSHPGGEVEVHDSGTDTAGEGNFTAGDHEVYSWFWQPDTGQTVTLTYRIEGEFRVHSVFRGP